MVGDPTKQRTNLSIYVAQQFSSPIDLRTSNPADETTLHKPMLNYDTIIAVAMTSPLVRSTSRDVTIRHTLGRWPRRQLNGSVFVRTDVHSE